MLRKSAVWAGTLDWTEYSARDFLRISERAAKKQNSTTQVGKSHAVPISVRGPVSSSATASYAVIGSVNTTYKPISKRQTCIFITYLP